MEQAPNLTSASTPAPPTDIPVPVENMRIGRILYALNFNVASSQALSVPTPIPGLMANPAALELRSDPNAREQKRDGKRPHKRRAVLAKHKIPAQYAQVDTQLRIATSLNKRGSYVGTIVEVLGPNEFYVITSKDVSRRRHMNKRITTMYAELSEAGLLINPNEELLTPGLLVVCLTEGSWLRARIIQTCSLKIFLVGFIDFARPVTAVGLDSIQFLYRQYLYPPCIVVCQLSFDRLPYSERRVGGPGGRVEKLHSELKTGNWGIEALAKFHELIFADAMVSVKFLEKIEWENGPWKVELKTYVQGKYAFDSRHVNVAVEIHRGERRRPISELFIPVYYEEEDRVNGSDVEANKPTETEEGNKHAAAGDQSVTPPHTPLFDSSESESSDSTSLSVALATHSESEVGSEVE